MLVDESGNNKKCGSIIELKNSVMFKEVYNCSDVAGRTCWDIVKSD